VGGIFGVQHWWIVPTALPKQSRINRLFRQFIGLGVMDLPGNDLAAVDVYDQVQILKVDVLFAIME
jgi:hypothetical protein